MKKYKILAVEDEKTTQILMQQYLAIKYELVLATSLKRAKEHLTYFRPDLILLDIHLPDGNGFDFFDLLKQDHIIKRIPVIFLTLNSDTQTKVKSFLAGAYDYITKPFDPNELVARIDAHCARSAEVISAYYTPQLFDDIYFNKESHQVYRLKNNGERQLLSLSPIELKLLDCFITNLGKTLSREHLAKVIWNKAYFQSRTIDRHISSLRKKLGATGSKLQTISHEGYLLSPEAGGSQ